MVKVYVRTFLDWSNRNLEEDGSVAANKTRVTQIWKRNYLCAEARVYWYTYNKFYRNRGARQSLRRWTADICAPPGPGGREVPTGVTRKSVSHLFRAVVLARAAKLL